MTAPGLTIPWSDAIVETFLSAHPGWVAEVKHNGHRAVAELGRVRSRSGRELEAVVPWAHDRVDGEYIGGRFVAFGSLRPLLDRDESRARAGALGFELVQRVTRTDEVPVDAEGVVFKAPGDAPPGPWRGWVRCRRPGAARNGEGAL